ncbi:MAG: 6-carboxytetrahydropterin synthase [Deltaproteobacteria bacterium]|nr:6-carboxytetrahydropterin synthase [Deltaproteobacteria bacterium]
MENKSPHLSLTASYDICAAHQLNRPDWDSAKNRAAFGHCADLHGHQYKLEVTLEGDVPAETGMIINGYEIDRIVREKIMSRIDHKFLNKDIPFFQ